jgi:glycosyltransferase involved in cell wall biosynthesis
MTITHNIEDFSKLSGGLRTVVEDLNKKLILHNIDSDIITTKAEIYDKVTTCSRSLYKDIWCYSSELKKIIIANNSDINHIHGIWMYPQYIAAKISYNTDIPYIITAHGMLEPWLWGNGTSKKKIYFNLMIKQYFSKANLLHAITPNEKDNLYKLFGHKNIEVIPNSISYKEIDSYRIIKQECERYVLFIGRLHPVKGIDLLIKAFSKLKDKNIRLKIAGPINEYKNELDILIKNLNIQNRVEFLGMVTGQEKFQLFKNAWVFAAPSFSEVVGMVNLEAGISGTPVITTHQTGLYSEWNDNGGMLINPDISELEKVLSESVSWTENERNDRGQHLKQFIIENYSWEKNIYKWLNLYNGLIDAKIK